MNQFDIQARIPLMALKATATLLFCQTNSALQTTNIPLSFTHAFVLIDSLQHTSI